uniref:Secreted protein n=1 Tax=Macrostomum lignano TaxID=282301 RepID=A0A1I8IXB9_9PLAT
MVAWMCRLSAALPTCSYGAPVCGFCSRRQYGSSACTLSRPTASPTLLAAGRTRAAAAAATSRRAAWKPEPVCHLSSSASESLWVEVSLEEYLH